MTTTILWKRDTAAAWTSSNRILNQGEAGYELDTGKFKIGNGSTPWNSLPYDEAILPAHGHVPGDVAGTAVITTDPRLSDARTPTSHGHTISEVSGLQTALDAKAPLVSPAFTTPNIGAASGASLTTTGEQISSGGKVGYGTGAGGTVTQATSRTTGVTLNKLCGNITMFSSAVAAQGVSTFTLTNSFIAATDMIIVRHISATNGGAWNISVVAGAGSCTITVRNISTASITEATPLRFTIIKGVTA